MNKVWVGIDVSKKQLDVHLRPIGETVSYPKGIRFSKFPCCPGEVSNLSRIDHRYFDLGFSDRCGNIKM